MSWIARPHAIAKSHFNQKLLNLGAVYLDSNLYSIKEFQAFVKPVINPTLTPFCKSLTGIKQEDVDKARKFPEVFNDFIEWCKRYGDAFIFASYGFYDKTQLKKDCVYHGMEYPQVLENHISIKHLFADSYRINPCGMAKALQILQLPLVGQHHRALDDAKNIAKILISIC